RLNLVLVAHVAHRHVLDQMFSQDAHFLLWVEVTSGSFHFGLHVEPTLYRISAAFPFSSGAKQSQPLTM
ncbi:MAG: hypothetical protein ACK5NG_11770, partial [Chthoniobacterales bacterium]